jgi:hypothetical protein
MAKQNLGPPPKKNEIEKSGKVGFLHAQKREARTPVGVRQYLCKVPNSPNSKCRIGKLQNILLKFQTRNWYIGTGSLSIVGRGSPELQPAIDFTLEMLVPVAGLPATCWT